MGEEFKNYDLSALTFDGFVAFFFARKVVPDDQLYRHFSTDLEGEDYDQFVPSSPERLVGYLTMLMTEFASIARNYTAGQIDQAIWGLWSIRHLQEFIFKGSASLASRIECIREMSHVFHDYVAKREKDPEKDDDDGGIWMWWDLVVRDFWTLSAFRHLVPPSGDDPLSIAFHADALLDVLSKARSSSGEDPSKLDLDSRAVLDALFETLTEVLAIPNRSCQQSALHGLGHLYHPNVYETVQRFSESHPTAFDRKWVEQCRDCRVL